MRVPILASLLALSLAASPALAAPGTARAPVAAAPAPAAAAVAVTPDTPPADDDARYAEAERATPQAADFEGGSYVVIGLSTTALVVIIILLVLII